MWTVYGFDCFHSSRRKNKETFSSLRGPCASSCLTASASTFISRVNCVVWHDTNNFTCKCLVHSFFISFFRREFVSSARAYVCGVNWRWAFSYVSAKCNNHTMWVVWENVLSTWAVEIQRKCPRVVFGGGNDVDDNIHCISTFSLEGRTTEIC